MVFDRVGGFFGLCHLYKPKYDERQENYTKMVSGRSSAVNEVRAFGNMFLCTFFGLILVKTY